MSLDCPEVEIAREELRRAIAELRGDVGRAVGEWVIHSVRRMLEASGAGDDDVVSEALERAESEARAATATAIQDLSALDAESALRPGSRGPLECIVALHSHPTRVLEEAGIPPVVRDEFEVRHFPDDVYGLRIRSFADLPDGDRLTELHVRWGVAKAALLLWSRGSRFEAPGPSGGSSDAAEPHQ